jgi:hypothetical protein
MNAVIGINNLLGMLNPRIVLKKLWVNTDAHALVSTPNRLKDKPVALPSILTTSDCAKVIPMVNVRVELAFSGAS